ALRRGVAAALAALPRLLQPARGRTQPGVPPPRRQLARLGAGSPGRAALAREPRSRRPGPHARVSLVLRDGPAGVLGNPGESDSWVLRRPAPTAGLPAGRRRLSAGREHARERLRRGAGTVGGAVRGGLSARPPRAGRSGGGGRSRHEGPPAARLR